MLDHITNNAKENRGCRDVVLQKNAKDIMYRTCNKRRSLTRAGTKRELMMTMRQRQLRFLGHVMRKDEFENVVLTGKIEGTRNRERKRLTYISSLSKCLDLSNTELLKATKDRELWKTMIANVRIG